MITVISLTKPISQLQEDIINWDNLPKKVKTYLLSGKEYKPGRQEMLVYDGRKIMASCSVYNWDDSNKAFRMEITDCWTKDGNLWPLED
ncbi:hypothetical protein ACH0BF_19605 [Pseudobacillus sp. 179-B 2D1 NHS]|uniref:hypothetical protein n=1 Tax=Pseudobacillus sp. 179-B 2D1 NHS TaxID=3374292 RepID=UPI0038791F95